MGAGDHHAQGSVAQRGLRRPDRRHLLQQLSDLAAPLAQLGPLGGDSALQALGVGLGGLRTGFKPLSLGRRLGNLALLDETRERTEEKEASN